MSRYADIPEPTRRQAIHFAVKLANVGKPNNWRRDRVRSELGRLAAGLCDAGTVGGTTVEGWRDLGACAKVWLWRAAMRKGPRDPSDTAYRARSRLAWYETGGGSGCSRVEFKIAVDELDRALTTSKPLSPRLAVALGAALVFYRSEKFHGTHKDYSFQSRFGICERPTCDNFFFRTGRGDLPIWCSSACGNAGRVARFQAARTNSH
jgi:hypothetical protein